MMRVWSYITALLLFLTMGNSLRAQDTFNPNNPPEPFTMYKVTVKATPADKANVSQSAEGYYYYDYSQKSSAMYKEGSQVYIHTSSRDSDYEFKYWLKNGEKYEQESQGFYYTVTTEDITFEAVYELKVFDPENPADPNMDYRYRLYLTADPEGSCSFRWNNGQRFPNGEQVYLEVYPNNGFDFLGWYDKDGQLYTSNQSFYFEMPNEDIYFTARFQFNPSDPSDPQSDGQTDIDNGILGDLNGDGVVDATDVAMIVNFFLAGEDYNALYDINKDSKVDVTDVTAIVNIYLDKK